MRFSPCEMLADNILDDGNMSKYWMKMAKMTTVFKGAIFDTLNAISINFSSAWTPGFGGK